MAQFPKNIKTGSAGLASAQAKSGGKKNFQNLFFWKDKQHRFLQFITDWEDQPTIPMHVGKGPKYMENFVCPRAWFGEDAECALCDTGWTQQDKQVAVAVEVEPVLVKKNGRNVPGSWEVATRSYKRKDDTVVESPNVGVIINTPTLFVHFEDYFADNGTVLDTVFKITRNGGDMNTSYTVTPQKGDIAEFDEAVLKEIDLAAWLESIANSEAIQTLVDAVGPNHEFNYSKRGKDDDAPVKSAAVADDDEDFDSDDDPEDEVDAATARKNRFNRMRAEMN